MSDIKTVLGAVGVSGAGVAFLYLLTQSLISKPDVLDPNLLFALLLVAFVFIFILAYKMLGKDESSRNSSVDIRGYNSGEISTGDTHIAVKKESKRDSSVSVKGHNTGAINTGDNNTIVNNQ